MVIGETDSVIRFGFLVEWMDAHFRYYSTAPPDCSLTRQSETAGRDLVVWDSGAEPFRLQKTAVHTSPADAGFVCLLPTTPPLRVGVLVFFA